MEKRGVRPDENEPPWPPKKAAAEEKTKACGDDPLSKAAEAAVPEPPMPEPPSPPAPPQEL